MEQEHRYIACSMLIVHPYRMAEKSGRRLVRSRKNLRFSLNGQSCTCSNRRSSFWFPRNLSNHMDRQARTRDIENTVVKSQDCDGRWSQ
jgi:hypothetical protein